MSIRRVWCITCDRKECTVALDSAFGNASMVILSSGLRKSETYQFLRKAGWVRDKHSTVACACCAAVHGLRDVSETDDGE